jgi:predicted nucleic acid binding AN1-type Zn finger protein
MACGKLPVCGRETCNKKANAMIGTCSYCTLQFCSHHRLPEDHACMGMQRCRQVAFDLNAKTLRSQKCVAAKL